jgi:predicted permease
VSWFTSFVAGVRALFQKRRVERELDEELEAYVEASAAHKRQMGMTAEEARRAALAERGSASAVKHQVWSSRWESGFERLIQDIRIGLRALARSPGFAVVALLSLALGIGANTAIFTLLNAVMLRPLPVPEPRQLVLFGEGKGVGSTGGLPDGSCQLFSNPFYRDFAAKGTSFSGVVAVSSIQMGSHLSINGGQVEHISIDLVSGNYFGVLGVPAAMGRVLASGDDQAPGSNPVAVASYGWFQRHFQGNSAALGQAIRIQGHDYTLIGVARAGFTGHAASQPADLWIPLSMEKEISPGWNGLTDHDFQSLYLFGRLKPGVSVAQAAAATNVLFRQIIRAEYLGDHPSANDLAEVEHASIELTPFAGGLPKLRLRFSGPLELLMAIVALVLLIACANIANMLLARGVARTRELAVRQALGATRRRVAVQLMTESLILAVAGGGLGVLLAGRGSQLLLALASGGPEPMPLDIAPDYRVLAFTLAVTVLTALLFGIAPALRAARLELTPALKEGRGSSSGTARGAVSRWLICGQIAITVLLLVAAGLFLRSLLTLARVDAGFDTDHVMVFSLDEYAANLALDDRLVLLQQQIERTVQALPGVRSASFSMFTFNQGEWSDSMRAEGVPPTTENSEDVLYNVIGTEYLQTMSIPLLAGRNFTAQDTKNAPQVAIVNETLARRFFPGGHALGRRFCLCDGNPAHSQKTDFNIEIVGVARNAHYVSLSEGPEMAAYFPYAQRIQYFGNFSVRYTGSPAALVPAVRKAVAQANPNIAIAQAIPLSEQVSGSIATPRLIGLLSAFFAMLAVFLAGIGVYGVMSYTVARRTSELGIRLALGAQRRSLLWLVLRESLLLLAAGLAVGVPIGLIACFVLNAFIVQQYFKPLDPAAFLVAILLCSAMTVLAAWIPARRAARVDPMTALRCE